MQRYDLFEAVSSPNRHFHNRHHFLTLVKIIKIRHSMGSMIISDVAEKIPNTTDKLVYFTPFIPQTEQSMLEISLSISKLHYRHLWNSVLTILWSQWKKISLYLSSARMDQKLLNNFYFDQNRTKPLLLLTQKVTLTNANFGSIPKFYIRTINDNVIGIHFQDKMIKIMTF